MSIPRKIGQILYVRRLTHGMEQEKVIANARRSGYELTRDRLTEIEEGWEEPTEEEFTVLCQAIGIDPQGVEEEYSQLCSKSEQYTH